MFRCPEKKGTLSRKQPQKPGSLRKRVNATPN